MTVWSVRAAGPADVDAMRRVEVEAGGRFRDIGLAAIADDPPPPIDELRAHLADDSAWVAELDGRVVGYATASVVDGHAHLDQVSVIPSAGGRGIGRALVECVHGWARDRGRSAITLTTFTDVAFNGPWYRSLGYEDLPDHELGPELAAIRRNEGEAGIEVSPRAAMRRRL